MTEKINIDVADIKQEKSNEELIAKTEEIIDSLKDFNYLEKYRVVSTLYDTFMDLCKKEGLDFIELQKK